MTDPMEAMARAMRPALFSKPDPVGPITEYKRRICLEMATAARDAHLAALSETHLIETQAERQSAIDAAEARGHARGVAEERERAAQLRIAAPLPAGDDGELCGQLKALARCEHSDLSVAEDAAARIAALNAEIARKDEALAKAASQISDLARQLGEAQGKLEASELPGIVDGWRAKCETLEAEVARLTKRSQFTYHGEV